MVSVTKVIEWDMGHRVPNHKHKCANPHGHRYRLELTVSGLVSEEKGSSSEGMVVDFSEIKQAMMDRIHDPLDHCFMAYEDDPMAQLLVREFHGALKIRLVPFIPTAENIVQWCVEQLKDAFSQGISISRCRLYETPKSWAEYLPQS